LEPSRTRLQRLFDLRHRLAQTQCDEAADSEHEIARHARMRVREPLIRLEVESIQLAVLRGGDFRRARLAVEKRELADDGAWKKPVDRFRTDATGEGGHLESARVDKVQGSFCRVAVNECVAAR